MPVIRKIGGVEHHQPIDDGCNFRTFGFHAGIPQFQQTAPRLIPIGVETLLVGGIGSECTVLIDYILTQLTYRLRKPFHEIAANFWQTLSVLVQRIKSNRILRGQQLLLTAPRPQESKLNVYI